MVVARTSGIYKITCTANGRFYIGSSNNCNRRWITHRRDLRGNYHHNPHLQSAFNKYGEGSFTFEVIETVELQILFEREQYWLDTLRPFAPIGFNIGIKADSGMRGRKASEETRAKLRAARKGITFTAERNLKISLAKKGVKRSPETCAKIGAASKGRKFTSERNGKISKANSKAWIVIKPDGTEIAIINLQLFCHKYELDAPAMCTVANGRRKHHKGWGCRHG